jgi:hypothetical protein
LAELLAKMNQSRFERVVTAINLQEPDTVPTFELSIDEKVINAIKPKLSYEDFCDCLDLDAICYPEIRFDQAIDKTKGIIRDEWGAIQHYIESLWQKEINQLTLDFIEEGQRLGYINQEPSHEAILAYFEILRKGIFVSSGLLANTAHNAEFVRDLVSLIHYGLVGKPQ